MKINVDEKEIEKIIKNETMITKANIKYLQKGLQKLKGEIYLNNREPLLIKYPDFIENKAKLIIKKQEKGKMNKNFEKNDKFFRKIFPKISPYHQEVNKLKITIKNLKTQNKKIKNNLQKEIKNNTTLKTENEKLIKILQNHGFLGQYKKKNEK